MAEETFRDLLRGHRLAAGLTQQGLADRAGISVRTVSDLERGLKQRPHRETLRLLVRALKLPREEEERLVRAVAQARAGREPDRERLRGQHHHNLPAPSSSFVGRLREVKAVTALVTGGEARLVTLTGTGGAGKTRLALRIAADLLDVFEDGVVFVPLATITDPTALASTIGAALQVRDHPGVPLWESICAFLRARRLLLVLDNFEQLLEAGEAVSALLNAAPRLVVMVTSRIVLHLSGEHEVAVAPLSLPARGKPETTEELGQYEAIALFMQRARAARWGFTLDEGNAAMIAEICRRVDGLPLAIELIAATIKHYPPQVILTGLSNRLAVLSGGPRDAPPRHRSMRAAIDWSFRLLDAPEQHFFARLAVFAGGWTSDAARAVCGMEGEGATRTDAMLAALVDKSLIYREEASRHGERYRMLETLQEYAMEQLVLQGDGDRLRRRHLAYYLQVAGDVAPEIQKRHSPAGLEHLDTERDNMRVALSTALEIQDASAAVSLTATLGAYWATRSSIEEARHALSASLALPGEVPPLARARALLALGEIDWRQSNYQEAVTALTESLHLFRLAGNPFGIGAALNYLGVVRWEEGQYEQATALLLKGLPYRRQAGDVLGTGQTLGNLGAVAYSRGDLERARSFYEESLATLERASDELMLTVQRGNLAALLMDTGELDRAETLFEQNREMYRAYGDVSGEAISLANLGLLWKAQGRLHEARRAHETALKLTRSIEEPSGIARSLYCLGDLALHEGRARDATALLQDGLTRFDRCGHGMGVGWCLEALACALALTDTRRAVLLFAAAAAEREQQGAELFDADQTRHDRYLALARDELPADLWDTLWEEGSSLSLADAVALALSDHSDHA